MKELMKKTGRHLGRSLLKILSGALIVCLVIVLLPRVGGLVNRLFPAGNERVIATAAVLTQELKAEGKLVFAEFDETGEFCETINLSLPFSLNPTVQSVSGTYRYTVSFGVNLELASVSYEENRLILSLPEIEVVADNYEITSTQVKDFWYKVDADRLEAIRLNQRSQRLASYTENEETMDDLRQMAIEKVGSLFEKMLETELLRGKITYEIKFMDPVP